MLASRKEEKDSSDKYAACSHRPFFLLFWPSFLLTSSLPFVLPPPCSSIVTQRISPSSSASSSFHSTSCIRWILTGSAIFLHVLAAASISTLLLLLVVIPLHSRRLSLSLFPSPLSPPTLTLSLSTHGTSSNRTYVRTYICVAMTVLLYILFSPLLPLRRRVVRTSLPDRPFPNFRADRRFRATQSWSM